MIGSLRGLLTCTLLSFVIRFAAVSRECRGQRPSPYNLQDWRPFAAVLAYHRQHGRES
jgi:hypothetical protein